MYSFYGGRPGNSFVIITTFKSVKDMVTAFKKGPDYKTVHYDEYVMINTDNKNNLENGRLYRRGYQFTNSMGGAEYIGTIAGPSGNAPQLTIETLDEVKARNVPDGYSGKSQNGEYSVSNSALVPGKTKDIDGNNVYNDSIKWASCSIVNENNEEATAYLGFTFPYPVIEFSTESVKPYLGGSYADTLSISRDDEMDHPFYESWNIRIPKGIKGDAFKNFRVITASSNDGVQQYDGQSDDRSGSREILVYDYYNYDKKENGNPKTLYLGDYNMIEGITMSNDGTITVQYTHNNDVTFSEKVKWIDSISLLDNGTFTIIYNTKTNGVNDRYSTSLDWIKSVDVSQDGTVTFIHNNETRSSFDNIIKWCNGVSINDQGIITFNWNDESSTQLQEPIQWIDEVALAADGTLTVTYNTKDENDQPKTQIFQKQIKWINNISLDNEGTLTVTYNTSDTVNFEHAIKSISSITRTVDNEKNGKLSINYNNGEPNIIENFDLITGINLNEQTGLLTAEWNEETINSEWDGTSKRTSNLGTINYIKDLVITDAGDLVVFYADPNKRGNVQVNGIVGYNYLGKVAPYGSNTNITISKIIRGKHFIDDSDNKNYLEFYIENIGVLRSGDTAEINSGTATIYYNGVNTTNPISLNGITVSSQTSNLSTINFKIELESTNYPINNTNPSIDLVDIQLKNVEIEVTRNNRENAATASIDQQLDQIVINKNNIQNLNDTITVNNSNINNRLNNLNTQKVNLQDFKNLMAFKSITITSSSNFFNSSRFSLKSGVINIYYNDFVLIVQGDIAPTRTIAQNEDVDILNLSTANLPHHFDDTNNTRAPLTRQLAGRNIMVNKTNNRIYYHDAGFSWGAGSTTEEKDKAVLRLDLIIPFDLTT